MGKSVKEKQRKMCVYCQFDRNRDGHDERYKKTKKLQKGREGWRGPKRKRMLNF